MVNAAGTKSALDNLEATTLTQNHVLDGHSDILEGNVAVAVGGIIVTVNLEHSVDGDAGGLGGHQDDRLLSVGIGIVGITLAHDDVDLASRVTSTAGPPLGAVEDVLVTLTLDAKLDVGGIRRRNIGLSHQESRADLSLHQRLEPLLLLRSVAVLGDDLHVASIGGGAVAGLGSRARSTQPLSHQGILQVGPAGGLGVEALGQEHVPETELLGLGLEILNDRRVGLPSRIAFANLGLENGVGTVDEIGQPDG